MRLILPDAQTTETCGAALWECLARNGAWIYLSGELGAGKTSLVRGFLRAAGFSGAIKSPTFTLVETYESESIAFAHFDLYRVKALEELDAIGLPEYFDGHRVCLVEWPEMGSDFLPVPDIIVELRVLDPGRELAASAASGLGEEILGRWERFLV